MPPEDEDNDAEDILRVVLDLWWTRVGELPARRIASARARTKLSRRPHR